jgi:hypothetical protein
MKNFYRENCNSKTDIGHFKNNILKELSAFKMLEEVKGRSKDIEKKGDLGQGILRSKCFELKKIGIS